MSVINWIKHRIKHKIHHFSMNELKKTFKENGMSLVVIIILWEIIEDIGFPALFIWMGANIHPIFLVGAPAAWILCLHWLAVPLMWGAWIRFKKTLSLKNEDAKT